MLQARRLGTELVVGVHSDEEILDNKGPTVMTLSERIAAVNACRWSSSSIPQAPYVTSLPWISHYGCQYVVHGDDITSDSRGEDCYRYVKAAGRFLVVKRTPGISTTDLVGRMLLCTKSHFIKSLTGLLAGEEGHGTPEERRKHAEEVQQKIKDYATDESGLAPACEVWKWDESNSATEKPGGEDPGSLQRLVEGKPPRQGQHVVYVDGGFDLFSSGHIEFLRLVMEEEEKAGRAGGWFTDEAKQSRISQHGEDYPPAYIIAGVHDDEVINHWKGVNYPIMNIVERGLCVLQCKYIHAIIFSAPFTPTKPYLTSLPYGAPQAVYHGPTAFMPSTHDPYTAPREMGIFKQVGDHTYQGVNAGEIVQRILKSREMYEERQRVKGVKGIGEDAVRRREEMEREADKVVAERRG
ncbi:MAG: hypothetical protein M1833_004873 [Piccolia ochrophora]|nr:MAG: hypothetical protein M1833_004873 [Piccolia ochrophora]